MLSPGDWSTRHALQSLGVIGDPDPRVSAYVEASAAHGRATVEGDSKSANDAHDRLAAVYRELRDEGQRERLLPLLNHADVAVRAWAAAHALEFAPDQGERVLGGFGETASETLAAGVESGHP
jgi:hypothetical protein